MTLCAHVPKYTWHHDAVIPVASDDRRSQAYCRSQSSRNDCIILLLSI